MKPTQVNRSVSSVRIIRKSIDWKFRRLTIPFDYIPFPFHLDSIDSNHKIIQKKGSVYSPFVHYIFYNDHSRMAYIYVLRLDRHYWILSIPVEPSQVKFSIKISDMEMNWKEEGMELDWQMKC